METAIANEMNQPPPMTRVEKEMKAVSIKQNDEETFDQNEFKDPAIFDDSFPGSTEDQVKLAELKMELVDEMSELGRSMPEKTSPFKLLRYLRGNNNSVEQAATAFRETLSYRKKHGIDNIRQELLAHGTPYPYPFDMPEFEPIVKRIGRGLRACLGNDLQGNIVTIAALEHSDLGRLDRAGLSDLYFRANIFVEEWFDLKLHELSVQQQRLVCCYNIIDCSGIKLTQFGGAAGPIMRRSMELQKTYPEGVVMLTAINVSWVTLKCWNAFISSLVPSHTKSKIKVCGKDFMDKLTHDISKDELPLKLGGSKSYAFDKHFQGEDVVVARGGTITEERVVNAGEKVSWRVRLEAFDIKVKLTFATPDESEHEIVPATIHDAEQGCVRGEWVAKANGKLVFLFDNSSAWIRSKTISLYTETVLHQS
eukprot:m.127780 g.127780  ORF g.127780 m.127780 type:complete len:423 (+) comp29297_c0_seq1:278-1546(+)